MARSTYAASAALLAIAAAASGCSGRKAPSEENFHKALEPVVRDAFCRTLDVQLMVPAGQDENAAIPIVASLKPPRTFGEARQQATLGALDDAARRGLLVRTESEAMAKERASNGQPARQRVVSYAPTPKGAAYFRAVGRRTSTNGGMFPAVCPAKGEIVKIVRWSDPAELFGRTVSQVRYRYRGVDPIDGISPGMRADLERPQERTIMLQLNDDGWSVPQP